MVRKALIDGEEVFYDICIDIEETLSDYLAMNMSLKYIGRGKVYSINGIVQGSDNDYFFFVKNSNFINISTIEYIELLDYKQQALERWEDFANDGKWQSDINKIKNKILKLKRE